MGLVKVYWPIHHYDENPGIIVGFPGDNMCCVIAIVSTLVGYENLGMIIENVNKSMKKSDINAVGPLSIVGHWNGLPNKCSKDTPSLPFAMNPAGMIHARNNSTFWCTLEKVPTDPRPSMKSIFINGTESPNTYSHIIFYEQPDVHHYLFTRSHDLQELLERAARPDPHDFDPASFPPGILDPAATHTRKIGGLPMLRLKKAHDLLQTRKRVAAQRKQLPAAKIDICLHENQLEEKECIEDLISSVVYPSPSSSTVLGSSSKEPTDGRENLNGRQSKSFVALLIDGDEEEEESLSKNTTSEDNSDNNTINNNNENDNDLDNDNFEDPKGLATPILESDDESFAKNEDNNGGGSYQSLQHQEETNPSLANDTASSATKKPTIVSKNNKKKNNKKKNNHQKNKKETLNVSSNSLQLPPSPVSPLTINFTLENQLDVTPVVVADNTNNSNNTSLPNRISDTFFQGLASKANSVVSTSTTTAAADANNKLKDSKNIDSKATYNAAHSVTLQEVSASEIRRRRLLQRSMMDSSNSLPPVIDGDSLQDEKLDLALKQINLSFKFETALFQILDQEGLGVDSDVESSTRINPMSSSNGGVGLSPPLIHAVAHSLADVPPCPLPTPAPSGISPRAVHAQARVSRRSLVEDWLNPVNLSALTGGLSTANSTRPSLSAVPSPALPSALPRTSTNVPGISGQMDSVAVLQAAAAAGNSGSRQIILPSSVQARIAVGVALKSILMRLMHLWKQITLFISSSSSFSNYVVHIGVRIIMLQCACLVAVSTIIYREIIDAEGRERPRQFLRFLSLERSQLFQQLILRIRVCAQWPTLWGRVWRYKAEDRTRYLSAKIILLSSVCSTLVNHLLGFIVFILLCFFGVQAMNMVDYTYRHVVGGILENQIRWLSLTPLGFKLNAPVTEFLGGITFAFLSLWNDILKVVSRHQNLVVVVLAILSLSFGASLTFAFLDDWIGLLSRHVKASYIIITKLMKGISVSLKTLLLLFRGRKFNSLRNRVDTLAIDLERLMLGTLVFAVLVFLWPTVTAFYLTFLFATVAVSYSRLAVRTLSWISSSLPVYVLGLHLQDPASFSGGVRLILVDPPVSPSMIQQQQQQDEEELSLRSQNEETLVSTSKNKTVNPPALSSEVSCRNKESCDENNNNINNNSNNNYMNVNNLVQRLPSVPPSGECWSPITEEDFIHSSHYDQSSDVQSPSDALRLPRCAMSPLSVIPLAHPLQHRTKKVLADGDGSSRTGKNADDVMSAAADSLLKNFDNKFVDNLTDENGGEIIDREDDYPYLSVYPSHSENYLNPSNDSYNQGQSGDSVHANSESPVISGRTSTSPPLLSPSSAPLLKSPSAPFLPLAAFSTSSRATTSTTTLLNKVTSTSRGGGAAAVMGGKSSLTSTPAHLRTRPNPLTLFPRPHTLPSHPLHPSIPSTPLAFDTSPARAASNHSATITGISANGGILSGGSVMQSPLAAASGILTGGDSTSAQNSVFGGVGSLFAEGAGSTMSGVSTAQNSGLTPQFQNQYHQHSALLAAAVKQFFPKPNSTSSSNGFPGSASPKGNHPIQNGSSITQVQPPQHIVSHSTQKSISTPVNNANSGSVLNNNNIPAISNLAPLMTCSKPNNLLNNSSISPNTTMSPGETQLASSTDSIAPSLFVSACRLSLSIKLRPFVDGLWNLFSPLAPSKVFKDALYGECITVGEVNQTPSNLESKPQFLKANYPMVLPSGSIGYKGCAAEDAKLAEQRRLQKIKETADALGCSPSVLLESSHLNSSNSPGVVLLEVFPLLTNGELMNLIKYVWNSPIDQLWPL